MRELPSQDQPPNRRFRPSVAWRGEWLLVVALVAALVVVDIATTQNDDRRLRLQRHGLRAEVTIMGCQGNLGGSGSTSAGFTCTGSYRVAGHRYVAVITGLSTFAAAGRRVAGVVDPADHTYLITPGALSRQRGSSPWPVIILTGLSAVSLVLVRRRLSRQSVVSP